MVAQLRQSKKETVVDASCSKVMITVDDQE